LIIKNSTKTVTNTSTKNDFVVAEPKSKASYGMVRMLASYFSKLPKCPSDIKWGTLHGHFLASLNDKKNPLLQGEVVRLRALKSIPAKNLKAMRSYKKLVAKG
tara:strand:+ start:11 stop:319 length:309 start_codon:yes stop_codon:yes gene_type:complete